MKKLVPVVSTATLLCVLAACGSPADNSTQAEDSPVAEAALYEGDDRQEHLESCAAEEGGQVTYYTAQNDDLWEPLVAAFEEKYPDITVETIRRPSGDTAQAVTEEARANNPVVDVLSVTSTYQPGLAEYWTEFTSPELESYPDSAMSDDSRTVITDRLPYGLIYNTSQVSEDEVPQAPEDLLDDRWAGRLGMSSSTVGTLWMGVMVHLLGEEVATDLGALDVHVQDVNSAALASMVAAGEIGLASASPITNTLELQADGAPVAWSPVSAFWLDSVAGLSATAPHPCSGMLFIDFMISEEGQTVNPAYFSSHEGVPDSNHPELAEFGDDFEPVDLNDVIGEDEYGQLFTEWADLIESEVIS